MKKFKNQAEMMQALLDGKKIRHVLAEYGKAGCYYMKDGFIYTKEESGKPCTASLGIFEHYYIYEPPKNKKKITLYTYLLKYENGEYIEIKTTSSKKQIKEDDSYMYNNVVLIGKTGSEEIEVDE